MWMKAAVLGGLGIIFNSLAVWTMALKIAFHSSCNWVNSVVVSRPENNNEIDRIPDEESNNGIDRLPDDILGDIVSRLKLIEASQTSILSRRWRKFWTMKSELYFTYFSTFDILYESHTQVADGDKQRFIKAVDQCLQLYSAHGCKLRIFFLPRCFLNGDTCYLVRWMQTLARLDIEVISLGYPCRTCTYKIPEIEYTFAFKLIDGLSSLKYLRLLNCYVETSFVGQCISLTRIDMEYLVLLDHQLSDILMSCPSLSFLSMRRCELPLNLRISGPNLKLNHVEITKCYDVEKIEISDNNVMTVFIDMRSEVEISLSSLPQMKKLNLRVRGMNYRFGDVTRDLPKLIELWITTRYQVLWLPPTFRAFRNIRKLVLLTNGDPKPEDRRSCLGRRKKRRVACCAA